MIANYSSEFILLRSYKHITTRMTRESKKDTKKETWGLGLEHEFFVAYGNDRDDICPKEIFDSDSVFQRVLRREKGINNDDENKRDENLQFPQSRPIRMMHADVFGSRVASSPASSPSLDRRRVRERSHRHHHNEGQDSTETQLRAQIQDIRDRQPLFDLFLHEPLLLQLPSLLPLPDRPDMEDRDAYNDTVTKWLKNVVEVLMVRKHGETPSDFDTVNSLAKDSLTEEVFQAIHSKHARENAYKIRDRLCSTSLSLSEGCHQKTKRNEKSDGKKEEKPKKTNVLEIAKSNARRLFAEYVSQLKNRGKSVRKGDVLVSVYDDSFLSLGMRTFVFINGSSNADDGRKRRDERKEKAKESIGGLSVDDVREKVVDAYAKAFPKFARFVLMDNRSIMMFSDEMTPPRVYANRSIDVDGRFIEVKSTKHLNATVDRVLLQVKQAEDRTLAAVDSKATKTKESGDDDNHLRPYVYPYSGVHCVSSSDDETKTNGITNTERGSNLHDNDNGEDRAETVRRDVFPTYAGSYHVWLTLPHAPALLRDPAASVTGEAARLARCHALTAHRLQWVEPLLISMMSGDPRAVGAGLRFPRASMRSTMNYLSGFSTTDVTKMLYLNVRNLPKQLRERYLYRRIGKVYFDSVEDALRAIEIRKHEIASVGDPTKSAGTHVRGMHAFSFTDKNADRVRPWINIGGEWILDRACFNVERANWGASYMDGAALLDPAFMMNSDAQVPYARLLNERGAQYTVHDSNDIRVINCGGAMSYHLQEGWTPFWVRASHAPRQNKEDPDEARGDHFILHFVKNGDDGPVSFTSSSPAFFGGKNGENAPKSPPPLVTREAPLDEKRNKKNAAVGFEFRVPDNCPREEMREVLRFICLVAASAVEDEAKEFRHDTEIVLNHIMSHRPIEDKHWNEALVNVSTMGCFVPLSEYYVKKVRGSSCFVGLPSKSDDKKNDKREKEKAAFDRLSMLARSLHRAYAEHPVYVSMTGAKSANAAVASGPPRFVNRNFMAWKSALTRHPIFASSGNHVDIDKVRRIYDEVKKRNKSSSSEISTTNMTIDGWAPDTFYLERFLRDFDTTF